VLLCVLGACFALSLLAPLLRRAGGLARCSRWRGALESTADGLVRLHSRMQVVVGQASKKGGMQVLTAVVLLSDVVFKVAATAATELADHVFHRRVVRNVSTGACRPSQGSVLGRPTACFDDSEGRGARCEGGGPSKGGGPGKCSPGSAARPAWA